MAVVTVTVKSPRAVGVPDNSPADDNVSPEGRSVVLAVTVGVGNPVVVNVNE